MKLHCVEATLDIQLEAEMRVRLWLDRGVELAEVPNGLAEQAGVHRMVHDHYKEHGRSDNSRWMKFLLSLSRVNAAQVQFRLDEDGSWWGAMAYTVPFDR